MKIALYLRVSTDVQDYNRQKNDLTALVDKEKNEIAYIFSDKVSGFKDERNRPDLKKLIQLTKKDIDAVYITELSRLSRNPTHLKILIEEFTEKGINVFSLTQNINTLNKDGKPEFMTNLMVSIVSEFSSYEVSLKNQRVASGKKDSILSKGNSYTYKPPFGYKKDGKKLVIHDQEAEIIKEIFSKYANGESIKDLVQYLNLKKVPTRNTDFMKRTEFKVNKTTAINKSDIKWGKSSIRNILRNTVYCGYKEIQGGDEIATPAIISEVLFAKCQDEIRGRIVNTDKSLKNDFMLRGLFICGECRKQFLGSKSHGSLLYKCSDRTHIKSNSYIGCRNTSIFKIHVEEMVWSAIKDTYQQLKTDQIKEGNIVTLTNDIENYTEQINSIKKEIISLDDESGRMVKLYAKGSIPDAILDKEQKRINNEKSQLMKKLEQIQSLNLNAKATRQAIEEMNANPFDLAEVEKSYHLQKEAVREIIKEIIIYKIDNKFTVFKLIFKAGYTQNIIRETWRKKCQLVDSYNLTFDPITKLFQNNNQVEFNKSGELVPGTINYKYTPEELYRSYTKYPELMEITLP